MSATIQVKIEELINYAAVHLEEQMIVGDIKISGLEGSQVVCRITAAPEFFSEKKIQVTVQGTTAVIPAPKLILNDKAYREEFIEAKDGEVKIELYHPDEPEKILGFFNQNVRIQPYLHWDGSRFPHTMPGFMQPNDPLVKKVLKRAGEIAAKEGKSISGYQGRSKADVERQAKNIFQALREMKIHYFCPPASFEPAGQKIRLPREVLHEDVKQGTCLDLAVLYATCLKAAALNSVIIVIPGHAFAGVWLEDKNFAGALVYPEKADPQDWATAKMEILPVECTLYREEVEGTFEYAVESAREKMEECRYLIDVEGAACQGMGPVFAYTDKPICGNSVTDFEKIEYSNEKKSRLELLKDQAMDITAKSKLLNADAVTLALEFEVDTSEIMKRGADTSVLSALLDGKVSGKKKNQEILRDLYSKSRQNLRETGKTNLFFAVNGLKWNQESNKKGYLAALYLCPAEIRRNTRGDFRLHVNFEDMFFNPALKVMLEHGYHLDCSPLADDPGDNYPEQMRFLNFLIEKQNGWEIVENTARLAQYHIPNEAIWKGLSDEEVLSHEIVSGILDCKMSWDNAVQSKEKNEEGLYAFEADSSQAEIIESAFERKAQVVVGPAGNGKTQTVVNIMMEAIRRGEKVLFVSEKAPALEVASEKLNQALAGVFNLMILKGKHRTSDVTAQIRKTLEYIEVPRSFQNEENMAEAKNRYKEYSQYLEGYYEMMKQKNDCGKSLEELIEMYSKHPADSLMLQLDDECGKIPYSEAEDQMRIFAAVMEECDRVKGDFSEYIRYDNLGGVEEQKTLNLAEEALERFEKLNKAVVELGKELSACEYAADKAYVIKMVKTAALLNKCPVCNKKTEQMLESNTSGDASFKQQLMEKMKAFGKISPRNFLIYGRKKDEMYEMLRKIYSPAEAANMVENPEEALEKIDQESMLSNADGEIIVGEKESDVTRLKAFLEERDKFLAGESDIVKEEVQRASELIIEGNGWSIQPKIKAVLRNYLEYDKVRNAVSERIVRNEKDFEKNHPDFMSTVLFKEWIENRNVDTNRNRSVYDEIVRSMEKQGYANLIKQVEQMRESFAVTEEAIINGFQKAWAAYQIEKAMEKLQNLSKFNYAIFKNRVENLAKEEAHIHEELKNEIFQIHLKNMPNIQEGESNNTEFGILQKLIRNKKVSIRSYFEQAPQMLQKIFPCMIMDPAAVAEYIPTDFPKFDLVVIDEGSQMPTYNALIPISKADRCMIFGDEKQLQPRDEFKKQVEEEFGFNAGTESILTAAYVTSMPRKMLRFHYRSENEGLIAFSNHRYYNGDIITFPTCDTSACGVTCEFVEDGFYDRDGHKGNEKEAMAVLQKIRAIYADFPNDTECTVGVITLNVHQRDLIQKMLLKETRADSEFGMKVDELVSVVNLESCQGKEWDYVILSPGFGYDKDRKFSMNFGALNREYGENRLNVMLTRGRKKMFVITSIEPHMISNAREQGTKDFKEFLMYARGEKTFDSRARNAERRKSGLVNAIALELEAKGYEIHTDIGSSEFKVDIGIVSKQNPEEYALGILLDSFGEQRSSIHDREVIYQKSLEHKGWKIYRLRKLNWYNDSQREIRQILKLLEKIESK